MSDTSRPSDKSMARMERFVEAYRRKTGTCAHPMSEVGDTVVQGLARHVDEIGKPLCPCRFYPDKEAEIQQRTWICACEDMKIYKYCHCLLFTDPEGMPITEHLPEGHEGREMYGVVKDPTPDKGRESRHKAAEREKEREDRPS